MTLRATQTTQDPRIDLNPSDDLYFSAASYVRAGAGRDFVTVSIGSVCIYCSVEQAFGLESELTTALQDLRVRGVQESRDNVGAPA